MILSHKAFQSLDGREVQLVITCASDQVEATIWYYQHGDLPRVLAHESKALFYKPNKTDEEIFEETIGALDDLCKRISQKAEVIYSLEDVLTDHQRIHRVRLVFASPWTEKSLSKVTHSFEKPEAITPELIDKLAHGDDTQGYATLERFVASAKLNGYALPVESLAGKKGTTLELAVLASRLRFDHLETFYQVLTSNFNTNENEISIAPLSSSLLGTLHTLYNTPTDCVLLYTHGHYSDCFVFSDGMLDSYHKLTYSSSTLLNELERKKLSRSKTESESLLSMFNKGVLSEELQEKVGDLLDVESQVLESKVAELSKQNSPLPRDWFFVTNSPAGTYLARHISKSSDSLRVVSVTPRDHAEMIDEDQSSPASVVALIVGINQSVKSVATGQH